MLLRDKADAEIASSKLEGCTLEDHGRCFKENVQNKNNGDLDK